LDPKQFQIALDNAKANLTQVALNIQSMRQDYQRMLSDVDSQQAKVDLDQARFTLDSDKSKLKSLQQQAQVQLARLDGNPDIPVEHHPAYIQAQSQVDEAQRQLDHTVVKAPFAGIVTNVPSIAP